MDRAEAIIIGRVPKDNSHFYQKDGILFAVVGELGRLYEEKQRTLINTLDLQSPEGIAKAQKEKAILEGIELCMTMIEGFENGPESEQPDTDAGSIDTREFISG